MKNTLSIDEYLPRSELVTPVHLVPRARYPAIDDHNHLPMAGSEVEAIDMPSMLREMDAANIATVVNLSGGSGDALKINLEKLDFAYPGRFVTFCNVDWTGVGSVAWTRRATAQLAADVRAGARGLKIFKQLGLHVRDEQGALVMPDDPRLADLWEQAAELNVPVLIHTADPVAFFRPLDAANERWDELQRHPDWHFYGPAFPPFEALIESLYRLIEAHPRTQFITAHVGCYPENLGFVSQMMDRYPNFVTDISARLAELGRAPYRARAWFIAYADRILFGTDAWPNRDEYQIHFRFLETADEYFDYFPSAGVPPQGRWKIYGVYLPDDVLKKVYHDNAARVLRLEPRG